LGGRRSFFFRLFVSMNLRVATCLFSLSCITLLPFSRAAEGRARSSEKSSGEAPTKADYILQPQDVIKVQVFQEEDINKQAEALSLSQESSVTLPLIGTVSLKGRSVRQAEEFIRGLYDKDFIVNPQVSVTVVKYTERTVNVVGSVTNQGRIQFPQERGLTILDAISLAGGQTRLADMKHVKLTRGSEVVIVDVDAMMKSGGRDPVQLEPDDVIYVPERIL
jgi:polysaccharide export outer membrane protein